MHKYSHTFTHIQRNTMMNKLLTAIQLGRSFSMDNVVSLPKVFAKTNKKGPKENDQSQKRKTKVPKVFAKTNKKGPKGNDRGHKETNDPKTKPTNKNGPKRNDRGKKRKSNNGYKNREGCRNILKIKI